MGFFNKESEADKIAKIKALRAQREEVEEKYRKVQKSKALDRIYAKEKAELAVKKAEISNKGRIFKAVASAAVGFGKVATSDKAKKAYAGFASFSDNLAKSRINQDPFGMPGNSKYKKTRAAYDPIWGTKPKKGKRNEYFGY